MQNKKPIAQTIKDKRYPILLGTVALFTIALAKRFWGSINKRAFVATMAIGAVTAWLWQIWISYNNLTCQGWEYASDKILGLFIGKVTIEDVLFYPVTGGTYYLLKYLLPKFDIGESNNNLVLNITLATALALTAGSFFAFGAGGESITIAFMLPALAMVAIVRHRINVMHFLGMGIIVFVTANLWSYYARDWYYPVSFSWVKWGWMRGTPPEIFYWLNIAGWLFIYSLSELMDKLFERGSK